MATPDRTHWDTKYEQIAGASVPSLPRHFAACTDQLISASTALEIACGAGTTAVWLAGNGVQLTGYDISPVAISAATELAVEHGVAEGCTFAVHDFDHGLPAGAPVDLVVCNMFRDAALDDAVAQRLRPGGLLATAALTEVGAKPGRFRVAAGALPLAFSSLEELTSGEGDGVAWLVARKPY